mmetsp:Transcript_1656/g.4764  ORF Transcript_1656/g.4764 Transcript_1656/m.4764 type:complete len:248 (+) Transcript_1656:1865-2608(+)
MEHVFRGGPLLVRGVDHKQDCSVALGGESCQPVRGLSAVGGVGLVHIIRAPIHVLSLCRNDLLLLNVCAGYVRTKGVDEALWGANLLQRGVALVDEPHQGGDDDLSSAICRGREDHLCPRLCTAWLAVVAAGNVGDRVPLPGGRQGKAVRLGGVNGPGPYCWGLPRAGHEQDQIILPVRREVCADRLRVHGGCGARSGEERSCQGQRQNLAAVGAKEPGGVPSTVRSGEALQTQTRKGSTCAGPGSL